MDQTQHVGHADKWKLEAIVPNSVVASTAVALAIVAGLAGCSNGGSGGNSTTSTKAASTGVTVDGQALSVAGQASCTVAGDNLDIGIGDATNGVGAVISNDDAPVVHSIGLGVVDGLTLGFSDAAENSGSAQATKEGNGYKITRTATGIDTSTAGQAVTKSFEMDIACP